MRFLALIPARYASTRFPGKPLAKLGGKYIIQRVYERVSDLFDCTYVATDDDRIASAVESFGGKAIMTSTDHKSGTDRCWEAAYRLGQENFDVVVNIQGDEPFIHPSQLESIKNCFSDNSTQIATLVKPFDCNTLFSALKDPNSPKVVISRDMKALCFSRSIIPYIRGVGENKWLENHTFYKHIGMYAYRMSVLKEIASLEQTPLEKAESLEQLRWLENGYTIKVGITEIETVGIDTPEDLQKAERFLKKNEKIQPQA